MPLLMDLKFCMRHSEYLLNRGMSGEIWCKNGPEFDSKEGKTKIIVRALYGFKSSGATFRSLLAERLGD